MIELRGPGDWQDNVEYEVSANGTCPHKSIVDGIDRYRCGCPSGPCEEALATKRENINAYYRDIIQRGAITARDYIDPVDIRPPGRVFLPDAFGKRELESAAVLLLHYFQELRIWAPFRPDDWCNWLKKHALARDDQTIDRILGNPFWGPRFAEGFWALVDRGFIVPVVPYKEGDDIGKRLVHVTEEFILRCYLSSTGLKPKLMQFFRLLATLKTEAS